MPPIVTLTTDFGLNDHYVGTVKGVILKINPEVRIVDICNAVPSYDLLDGALTISQSYHYFPSDTIHMVVVDPGVGSARRPIIVRTERHTFIAPDNGVLSLVYDNEQRVSVRHITAQHYFLQPTSQTFHGRDIFAAVAGWLSKGVDVSKFGDEITDYVRFNTPKPKRIDGSTLKGVVLKVDKFGNLVTNLRPADIPALFQPKPPEFKITVGRAQVTRMCSSYAEAPAGELFGILGSMGYLEISANRGAAAQIAQAPKGTEVGIAFSSPQLAVDEATKP